MNTLVDPARVADGGGEHPTLFPDLDGAAASPRQICEGLGLAWMMACKLFEGGWLSFDPAATPRLSAAQKAEPTFLGCLVAGGCDEGLLQRLLRRLRKPYAYRLDRMYYDWREQDWKLLPRLEELRGCFDRWVEDLLEAGETASLESLERSVQRAMRSLRDALPW